MSEVDRQDVIEKLRKYESDLQGLMDLLSGKTNLTSEEKVRAQEQMKAIKDALDEDYRRGATGHGKAGMNRYERAYLHPAVHQASCEIRARWNSNPIASNWYAELYAARFQITYHLRQLEHGPADPQSQDAPQ